MIAVLIACVASGASAQGVMPTQAERQALDSLSGKIVGQIVWESSRDGTWVLYTMNADGSGARRLTSMPGDCTQACFSADGKQLLFTRTAAGDEKSVWVMDSDGTDARRLIDDAMDPQYRKGDGVVHFRRQPDRRKKMWQTWEYDLQTGEERLIFPPLGVTYEKVTLWSADSNDDGSRFVAWSPQPRGTWVLSADGNIQQHVHGGCESRVSPDGRYGYGVKTAGEFIRFSLADGGEPRVFNIRRGDWSHTYFPRVSNDGDWLIYGACPPDQHDQDTSDYELFIVPMRDWATQGEPVRLTFNKRTDRWPTIHVAPEGSANPLADGPADVAGNRRTNPPPPPLSIFTFASEDAGPDFGGYWGVWPNEGGCQGRTRFIAGDDAEGGQGGSLRVDYQIDGEPRSVAVWIVPEKAPYDFSAYDRFVLHARGDVPSFTLVVKDRNSQEEETPQGVADYFVRGVTTQWQRFELPFERFRPRAQGATIDWRGIKLMAIAFVDPRDPKSGTLQIDNLVAVPAAE